MSLSMEIRVGRKRTIVIPKIVAEMLGIYEGMKLKLVVKEGKIILEPIPDAITLSIHGEKIAKTTLKELEEESIKHQKA